MTCYECPRCEYSTNHLANFLTHLSRKRECKPIRSDVPLEQIKKTFLQKREDERKYECEYCNHKFKFASSRYRHLNICEKANKQKNLEKQIEAMSKQLAQLQKSVDKQAKQTTTLCNNTNNTNNTNSYNNIINSNNVTNNNIVILRDFGHENMAALPSDLVSSLILDLEYRSLLENLHFDPEFPENHNIRLKSTKRRIIEIYKDNKWNAMPYVNALNDIIIHANRIFHNHYRKNKEEIADDVTEEELEEIERQLYQVQNGLNDNVVKPILKEIELIIEQYRDGIPRKNEEQYTISRPRLDVGASTSGST